MMCIRHVIAGMCSMFWHERDCSALNSDVRLYKFKNFEWSYTATILVSELIQSAADSLSLCKHIQVSMIWLDNYINIPIYTRPGSLGMMIQLQNNNFMSCLCLCYLQGAQVVPK